MEDVEKLGGQGDRHSCSSGLVRSLGYPDLELYSLTAVLKSNTWGGGTINSCNLERKFQHLCYALVLLRHLSDAFPGYQQTRLRAANKPRLAGICSWFSKTAATCGHIGFSFNVLPKSRASFIPRATFYLAASLALVWNLASIEISSHDSPDTPAGRCSDDTMPDSFLDNKG